MSGQEERERISTPLSSANATEFTEILRYLRLIISTAIVLHTFHYSAFPADQIIVDIMFPANLSVVN